MLLNSNILYPDRFCRFMFPCWHVRTKQAFFSSVYVSVLAHQNKKGVFFVGLFLCWHVRTKQALLFDCPSYNVTFFHSIHGIDVHNVNIAKVGLIASIPPICAFTSNLITPIIADYIRSSGILSISKVSIRKKQIVEWRFVYITI